MRDCEFIYEQQVKRCPIPDEQVEKVLGWLGIDAETAKDYCGVTTSAAVLICAVKHFNISLYPRHYVSPHEDTGR